MAYFWGIFFANMGGGGGQNFFQTNMFRRNPLIADGDFSVLMTLFVPLILYSRRCSPNFAPALLTIIGNSLACSRTILLEQDQKGLPQ